MVGKHVRDVQREDSGMLRDVAGMAKHVLNVSKNIKSFNTEYMNIIR